MDFSVQYPGRDLDVPVWVLAGICDSNEGREGFFLNPLLIASAVGAVYLGGRILRAPEYIVRSPKIPDSFHGYRILQVSDLHNRRFGEKNKNLSGFIRAHHPDLVAITGDLVSRDKPDFDAAFSLVEAICPKAECIFVPGNHEQRLRPSQIRRLDEGLRERGVRVLHNTRIKIYRENSFISLYGMEIPLRYYQYPRNDRTEAAYLIKERVEELLGSCSPEEYNILMTHNPLYFPAYAGWGADLTLCGHVHGGVMRLPKGKGLLSPERKLFPKYSGGIYRHGKSLMAVSRGLGDSFLGTRVFNPPEVVCIVLEKA